VSCLWGLKVCACVLLSNSQTSHRNVKKEAAPGLLFYHSYIHFNKVMIYCSCIWHTYVEYIVFHNVGQSTDEYEGVKFAAKLIFLQLRRGILLLLAKKRGFWRVVLRCYMMIACRWVSREMLLLQLRRMRIVGFRNFVELKFAVQLR